MCKSTVGSEGIEALISYVGTAQMICGCLTHMQKPGFLMKLLKYSSYLDC